jgi:FKBP-type peptidyl-prolyl cis-trans isomerase FklB
VEDGNLATGELEAVPLLDAAGRFGDASGGVQPEKRRTKLMTTKLILNVAAVSLLTCFAQAQTTMELKDLKQRASYAIGTDIAANMKRQGLDLDPKALAAGLTDGFDGKMKLTAAELKQVMEEFRAQMMAAKDSKSKADSEKNLKDGEAYLAANGKKEGVKTTASGLQYKSLKAGKGRSPKATDTVKVHYHGTLIDGTVFDSSVERGEPISFPLNGVIAGWTEGVQLMKEGDKFQFTIPSKLAYGEQGAGGKIGPNATLIFDVELITVEGAK